MAFRYNPETALDGYKVDHRRQYPDGTNSVYSNWTPRGSRIPNQNEVVFFSLQYFLQRFMMEDFNEYFFDVPRDRILARFERRIKGYLGPGPAERVGVQHIADLHDLGYVPLQFSGLEEGTLTPLRVPQFVVENTRQKDKEFFWVTNAYETLASSSIWQPCTSATSAYRFRKLLNRYGAFTGAVPEGIGYQGHDFSFRGLPGIEAAAASGAAHLLSFVGTDTLPALDWIEQYYWGDESDDYVIGQSVAATEHSVMCAGLQDDEFGTINRLLDLYPTGILSIVSDTWDLWHVITNILPKLKDKIMARDGTLVIRPDSGVPVDILCGDPAAVHGTPASKGVVPLLWEIFGGTTNEGGYKVLDSHIGSIYGDAITYDRGEEIMQRLAALGFVSSSTVFGVGSFTYQYVTRDTFGNAMKATHAVVNGESRNLKKTPITDDGLKFSATGRLAVKQWDDGELTVIEEATPEQEAASLLVPRWKDGEFLNRTSISQVRAHLWSGQHETSV